MPKLPQKKKPKLKYHKSVSHRVYDLPVVIVENESDLRFPEVSKKTTLSRQLHHHKEKEKEMNIKYEKYIN